jgi:hypothetical protein
MTENNEGRTVAEPTGGAASEAQAEMEFNVREMLKRGYVEVSEINNLKVGARVKHSGQRWPGAYTNGTATIERIFHKPVSSWSQKSSRQDIELIVRRDTPVFDHDFGYWADYHTELTEEA